MSNEVRLCETMDAKAWAQEFMRINPIVDEETMLAWFANSIMSGWDHAHWRFQPRISELEAQLAALTEALETKDRVLEHRAKKIDQLLELVRIAKDLHMGNPLPEFSKRREEFESGWRRLTG